MVSLQSQCLCVSSLRIHSTGHHSAGLVRWTLEAIARGNDVLKEGTFCIHSTTGGYDIVFTPSLYDKNCIIFVLLTGIKIIAT